MNSPIPQNTLFVISTPNLAASCRFYKNMGYRIQKRTNRQAFLYDGQQSFFLHQELPNLPNIQFVIYTPTVALLAAKLRLQGLQMTNVSTKQKGKATEAIISNPNKVNILLSDAETYLVNTPKKQSVVLGEWCTYTINTSDINASKQFWETLGFVPVLESEWRSKSIYLKNELTNTRIDLQENPAYPFTKTVITYLGKSTPNTIDQLSDKAVDFDFKWFPSPHVTGQYGCAGITSPDGQPFFFFKKLQIANMLLSMQELAA